MLARFRKTKPATPNPIDPAKVAEGPRVFAADLEAGDTFALDCIGDRGEMPFTAEGWAAYPTNYVRRVRIAYLGKPGPGDVPDEVWDRTDNTLNPTAI